MEERCWDCLDIEPTADTTVIKKAYAKQLKFNKPDKNPEGFRELRAAYEQALNESYWYEEDEYENDEDENEDTYEGVNSTVSAVAVKPPPLPKNADVYAYTASTEANDIPPAEMIDWHSLNNADVDEADSTYQDSDSQNSAYDSNDNYDEDNEDGVPLTKNEDEAFVLFDNDIWRDEWEQAVRVDDAIIDGGDERLLTLIQSQIDTPRPLDEQNDLEETLLSWFDDQPPLFPRSYEWAKEHFDWNARLKHWSYNHYPWYIIDSLNRRYEQAHYFHLPSAFRKFLLLRFPTIARYWPVTNLRDDSKDDQTSSNDNDNEMVPIKRLEMFKGLFFPINANELAYELNTLDQELTYYNHGGMLLHEEVADTKGRTFNAQYWQNESPLKDLNDWVFKHFIVLEDFGAIALAVVAVLGAASFMADRVFGLSWQNYFQDGIGVFITIALYYLFWQLLLRLFATPNTFIMRQPAITGWRNASIVLFLINYVVWTNKGSLEPEVVFTSPTYYQVHIIGASLFIANSLRSKNIVLKSISWYAGILLMLVAVVLPSLVIATLPELPSGLELSPITPLFWLLLALPISLFNLSEDYSQLAWLASVSNFVVKVGSFVMMGGAYILFVYSADILPSIDFGFTATVLMILAVVMTIGILHIVGITNDSD